LLHIPSNMHFPFCSINPALTLEQRPIVTTLYDSNSNTCDRLLELPRDVAPEISHSIVKSDLVGLSAVTKPDILLRNSHSTHSAAPHDISVLTERSIPTSQGCNATLEIFDMHQLPAQQASVNGFLLRSTHSETFPYPGHEARDYPPDSPSQFSNNLIAKKRTPSRAYSNVLVALGRSSWQK
jgi:hypothetical protein